MLSTRDFIKLIECRKKLANIIEKIPHFNYNKLHKKLKNMKAFMPL
jgi:hypothetical protein